MCSSTSGAAGPPTVRSSGTTTSIRTRAAPASSPRAWSPASSPTACSRARAAPDDLKERVDDRGQGRALPDREHEPEGQQEDHHGKQPESLGPPEEDDQLAGRRQLS